MIIYIYIYIYKHTYVKFVIFNLDHKMNTLAISFQINIVAPSCLKIICWIPIRAQRNIQEAIDHGRLVTESLDLTVPHFYLKREHNKPQHLLPLENRHQSNCILVPFAKWGQVHRG